MKYKSLQQCAIRARNIFYRTYGGPESNLPIELARVCRLPAGSGGRIRFTTENPIIYKRTNNGRRRSPEY
jgi:hypothetical protein